MGPGTGKAVQRLLHGKGLLRKIGPVTRQIAAGNSALHPRQRAWHFHGAVAAVAYGGSAVEKGFPAVAGAGKLPAHALLHNVDIVIKKNALRINVQTVLNNAFQLIRPGDLGVYNAVTVTGARVSGQRLFNAV